MKKTISLIIALLFLSISLNAKDINSETLVEKMTVAYGGDKELKQLNIYEQFWIVKVAHVDLNTSEYRMVMMPDYLRVKLRYLDTQEIKILDKKNGTIMLDGTIYKAVDSKLDVMKFQMMSLLSPIELKKKLDKLVFSEDEEFYILSLTENSLTVKYYISKDSYLLHKTTTKITIDSKEIALETIYDDYKIFNGVMLAHKESKFIDGVESEVLVLQETRFQNPLK